jgi:hypothetical protein
MTTKNGVRKLEGDSKLDLLAKQVKHISQFTLDRDTGDRCRTIKRRDSFFFFSEHAGISRQITTVVFISDHVWCCTLYNFNHVSWHYARLAFQVGSLD